MATITKRIIKKGKDKNGNIKENLTVWDVYYNFKNPTTGKWEKKSKKGFRTEKEAKLFEAKTTTQMHDNSYISPLKLTVRKYLNDWMETYCEPKLRENTLLGYKRNVDGHIIPALGNIELQKLTVTQIDKFYAAKQENGRLDGRGGLSQRSILYIHRVLCQALDHAVCKGLIQRNVAKDATVRPKKIKKFKHNIYSIDELRILLIAVKDTYMEVAIALGGICGMRRGEVLGLRWSDVDFDNAIINISQQLIPVNKSMKFTTTKTEESERNLPVGNSVMDILKRRYAFQQMQKELLGEHFKDANVVVCDDDGALIHPSNFSARFSDVLKRHGMKHIRFHDLRHSCATLMLEKGVDIKSISNYLGHSSIDITGNTYLTATDTLKRNAAMKIDFEI